MPSILVRRFPADVPSAVIQFSQQIVTFVIMLVALFLFQQPIPATGISDILLFVLVGIFGGTGVMCLVIAYRFADPGSVSPFEYFGIPFALLLGWWFFAEAPIERLFPGVFAIVAGGLVIIWRQTTLKKDIAP